MSEQIKPWALAPDTVVSELDVSPDVGLDRAEVRSRRKQHGPNRLRQVEHRSLWQILWAQFKSVVVLLLVVAAVFSFIFAEWIEGIAIAVVLLINAAIGFFTELRAVRSMEALQELGQVEAKVRREGHVERVPADQLVPGDVVLVEGGDVVTADLRLVQASKLQADESALTGESVPVSKQVKATPEDAEIAGRASMLFKGTAVTRGAGEGVVVAIGMDTELGHISSLVEEAQQEATPLQERLDRLGRRLVWATLAIGAAVVLAGVLAGRDLRLMVETAIALAVASIPEGLPIVATIALARGMWRMAQRNALVQRLSSVETLGATTIILTDKTGTLTENQMTVTFIALPDRDIIVTGEGLESEGQFKSDGHEVSAHDHDPLRRLLAVGLLCNDANLESHNGDVTAVGDPTEVALLVAGRKAGMARDQLLSEQPEAREVAFDPQLKMMATYHRRNGRYHVAVKGALEPVIDASSRLLTRGGERALSEDEREHWRARNAEMAENGLRVLAMASKQVDDQDAAPYQELTFLGLVGLLDSPREDVRPALQAARKAGVDVVMVTGDQPGTARRVALAVGLTEDEQAEVIHGRDLQDLHQLSEEERRRLLRARIFARVSPAQKMDLLAAHQDTGAIVAMTGDGVNDAPALKKADIGVAMGQRGTQVAREAADMVLTDDAFSTIVVAIRQGRVIFENIRKFVLYLLSCNISEIMVVSFASIVDAPLPIRPLQILFLNLVTDVFPALALGVGEGSAAIMHRPPRDPDEPIMTRQHWVAMGGYGFLITVSVLLSLFLAQRWLMMEPERAVTVSFLTLAFAQLWHVFDMRDRGSSFIRNDVTQNVYVWGALLLCTLLLLAAVYAPVLSAVLQVRAPGLNGWGLVLGFSLAPWAVVQVLKGVRPHSAPEPTV